MVPVVLASALLMAALPVRVESEDCPSSFQIEGMLAAMLPPLPDGARPDRARVKRRAIGLRIELSQADGSVIAERLVEKDGSCTELAELAAVVIASWESDVHPEFVRPHVEPTPAPVAAIPMAQRPTPAAWDAAAGAVLSYSRSLAAGGVLALTWIPWGRGFGLHFSAAVDTARTVDLEGGQARWRRWTGSAELDWRLARIPLDFHGGLVLGWLTASGAGFSKDNLSSVSFSPAASLGVRLPWWVTRSLAMWVDLAGLYWTRSQIVYAEPTGHEQDLPHFQGVASAGLAFGQVATIR